MFKSVVFNSRRSIIENRSKKNKWPCAILGMFEIQMKWTQMLLLLLLDLLLLELLLLLLLLYVFDHLLLRGGEASP